MSSTQFIRGKKEFVDDVKHGNLIVDNISSSVINLAIDTNISIVSVNKGIVNSVYHNLNSNVNNLLFSLSYTPSSNNIYDIIQVTLPNRSSNNANIQDIIGTVSVFDSSNKISINSIIYADITSNRAEIRFYTQSTNIHYITCDIKYISN